MSGVRVSCENCSSIELVVESITVRCCDEARQYAYRFRCPRCALTTVNVISLEIAALLLRAGAQVEHWQLPLEFFERPACTTPITHDDLIDFHEALERWTGFDSEDPAELKH